MRLRINDSQILWPGKQKKKPEGIIIPTHLKVLTIEEKPFVYVRKIVYENDGSQHECEPDEIPCPLFNSTEGIGKWIRFFFGRFSKANRARDERITGTLMEEGTMGGEERERAECILIIGLRVSSGA